MKQILSLISLITLGYSASISEFIDQEAFRIAKEGFDANGIDLSGPGPYTVFLAPTSVYELIGIQNGSQLDENLMRYAIVNGNYTTLMNGTLETTAIHRSYPQMYPLEIINSTRIRDYSNQVVDVLDITILDNGVVVYITYPIFPGYLLDYILDNPTYYSTLGYVANMSATAVSILGGPGAITLLAPFNAAFDSIDLAILGLLLDPANLGELELILTYHLLAGRVFSTDIVVNGSLPTLAMANIGIQVSPGGIYVQDALLRLCGVGGGMMVDVLRANGVLHNVACVLTPKNLLDVINENGLTELANALTYYGLGTQFQATGATTILGPTNPNFIAAAPILANLTMDEIVGILAYHTFPENVPSFAAILYAGMNVQTAIGVSIGVGFDGINLTVTDSYSQTYEAIAVDKFALNGILHVINGILIPGSIVDIVGTNPNTNLVAGLAGVVGLDLNILTDITLLFPNNGALNDPRIGALGTIIQKYSQYLFAYHVLAIPTLLDNLTGPSITGFGAGYYVFIDADNRTITDAIGNVRTITEVDLVGTDGVVQVIDGFLYPFDPLLLVNLNETIADIPELSVLSQALVATGFDVYASELTTLGYTVFGPTDEAFALLPDAVFAYFQSNITFLEGLLSFHIVNGTYFGIDLLGMVGQMIYTLAEIPLLISIDAVKGVFLIDPAGNNIYLSSEIFASNGVVYEISQVIEPEPGAYGPFTSLPPQGVSFLDIIANNSDLSTLLSVANMSANVTYFLMSIADGPYTVFAPINDAFSDPDINQGKLDAFISDTTNIGNLLGYHVVVGKVIKDDLETGDLLMSISGDNIAVVVNAQTGVFLQDLDPTNSDSNIVGGPIYSANGCVYLINKVLSISEGLLTQTDMPTEAPSAPAPTTGDSLNIKPTLIMTMLSLMLLFLIQ